jgi:hypothetical protein
MKKVFKGLPTEILALIFYQAIGSYTQTHSRAILSTLKTEADTIRAASQVSQLWRAITLGRQDIWGITLNMDFNSFLWIEEFVRRSGSSPLLAPNQELQRRGHSIIFLCEMGSHLAPNLSILETRYHSSRRGRSRHAPRVGTACAFARISCS